MAGATKELTNQLELHAKVAEAIGERVARASRWQLAGVDATPAPFRTVSIAQAFENFSGSTFGSSGTMSAALMITTAVKAVTVKPVGYSGLMLPVMEDAVLAKLWGQGTFTADSLLAYSAVCGTGLDTIPMPGDSTKELLMRIYGDVASLAWKWHKPLSARLLPMRGKRPGEMTEFQSKWLVNTTVGTFH